MSVTVVIPVYNAGERLLHALAGVAAQTRPADQVIIVDDGSGDDGVARARQHYPQYSYFSQERGGPSAARNRGIANATSEWVAFLDADDHWREDHLQTGLALLADGNNDGILSNRVDFYDDPQLTPVPAPGFAVLGGDGPHDLNHLLNLLKQGFYFCQSSVMLRRSLITSGYRVGMHWGEDIELFLRVLANGGAWCYSPERTVFYRADTPEGLSRNYAGTALGQFRAIRSIAQSQAASSPVYQHLLRSSSRRALLASLAYESSDVRAGIWREVSPGLSVWDKPLIWSLWQMPGMAGALHRQRHQRRKRKILAARIAGRAGQAD